MTPTEWGNIYRRAWHLYYTPTHIETLIKRAIAMGIRSKRITSMVFYFSASHFYEGVHPLQSGLFRRKRRCQRRPELPRENIVTFALKRAREMVSTYVPGFIYFMRLERLRRKLENDPRSKSYSDLALRPVDGDEFSSELELYHATDAARVAANQAMSRQPIHRLE